MKQGADIDIISGRPKEQVDTGKIAEEQARKESILKDRAKYLGISQSPDAQVLIELIGELLEKRLTVLIANDPEANTYSQILNALGLKENMAKKATDKLIAMKIENKE